MAHIAVVDSNRLGLRLLERGKVAGHEISFIRTNRYTLYSDSPENHALIAQADRVIEVENTADILQVQAALADIHAASPVTAVLSVNEYAV